ncbi:MAG TPA: hypothetical protein ACFYEK_03925 [Candidatus Wunengus sp. YC60]|uniref:hypothetical protein n=1 Tax=Candidatus Wunengus sp. YC60 TaxID=3367697 RepID=UPI0040285B20
MERPFFKRVILALGAALFIVLITSDAWAIPVFARKYQTTCSTCHWATFPALNPFGKAFKANGYRFPEDDEVFLKDSPVALGGEAWRRIFPNIVLPSTISHLVPIALLAETDFTVNPRISGGTTAFDGAINLELLTGGTLGESLSWFGTAQLYENNGSTLSEASVERLFCIYSPTLLGEKGLFNVQFGRFEPRAIPRSEHLSIIGTAPYLFSTWAILPTANFTAFFPNQNGVEFFGGKNGTKGNGGFSWASGIVNSEDQKNAMDMWDTPNQVNYGDEIVSNTKTQVQSADNPFDVNNSKDYYARISYKIGGMGVLGGGAVEESKKTTENWQEKSLTLSSFFYRGNAGFFNDPVGGTGWHSEGNHFWRYGMEADFSWWNFNFFGAATYFRDRTMNDVTIGSESGSNFDADLYTAELRWVALPWVIPAVRFENMNPSYDAGDIDSFNRYSTDITVLIRANVKFVIGAAFTDGGAPKSPFFDDVYRMGMIIGL